MLTGLKRAETGAVMLACRILFELFADRVVDPQERWCGKSRRAAQTSACATGIGQECVSRAGAGARPQNDGGRSPATAKARSTAIPARPSVPSSKRRPIKVMPWGTRRGGENFGNG